MAFRALILLVFAAGSGWGQGFPPAPADAPPVGGKDRTEELLKADHKANLKDLETIRQLSESIQAELEKHDRHVLSVGAIKKLDEMEKLTRRIRGRMKRF
ncbi:MAG: hypothetical protein INH43_15365 [Acidobacteriaceae bacterium]|jgi:hypothetical protein|nr:hypothetical protein [Acidobacteriaceae bacterium]